jgi:prepilin-type N-terminal cleavage/methylation domain-containing protein
MSRRPPRSAGFTILELILVVVIVGFLAAILLPSSQPAVYDQLRSTAQILATDLSYARSLAVANNDNYRITFNLTGNTYTLTHSGANPALNTLPWTPFSSSADTATQHVVNLGNLPRVGPLVRLSGVATSGTTYQSVTTVEYGSLGQTISANPTVIWLMAGNGTSRRYISLQVDPVTGLVQVNGYSNVGPPTGVTQVT